MERRTSNPRARVRFTPGPLRDEVRLRLRRSHDDFAAIGLRSKLSELAGIAKFVMRDRQNLGALRVRDGVIILEQMYFADEVRPLDEIKPRKAAVSKEELAMAEQLIDNFAGEFEPKKYKGTYRDALCEIIRAKRADKEVHRAPEGEEAAPPDLLEAFE